MNKSERVQKFFYHLGKGLWKSVPILGPIIEEVLYMQFEEELKGQVEKLSATDIDKLIDAMPDIDISVLEHKLGHLEKNVREFGMHQITGTLAALERDYDQINSKISDIDEKLEPLPNIYEILTELRSKADNEAALRLAIDEFISKRQSWIHRISRNQRNFLQKIPSNPIELKELWDIVRKIIPNCMYKEFRFRLHELEWLGLVKRYWDNSKNTWFYFKTNEDL